MLTRIAQYLISLVFKHMARLSEMTHDQPEQTYDGGDMAETMPFPAQRPNQVVT